MYHLPLHQLGLAMANDQGGRLLIPSLMSGQGNYCFVVLDLTFLPLFGQHVCHSTAPLFRRPQNADGKSADDFSPYATELKMQMVELDIVPFRVKRPDLLTCFCVGVDVLQLETLTIPPGPKCSSNWSRNGGRSRSIFDMTLSMSVYSGSLRASSVFLLNSSPDCCLIFFPYTIFNFCCSSFIPLIDF